MGLLGVPAARIESACASGAAALRLGFFEVASGAADLVMVCGVEKMNDVTDATEALAAASDREYEAYYGATFPSLYAMMARAHMDRYGTTVEQLNLVSIKAHRLGAKNPLAQFRREVTMKDVENSPMVAEPLRVMHCSPVTDGAAAVILCPLERAKDFNARPVKIAGIGAATASLALHDRTDLCSLEAVRLAGRRAYEMAGRKPEDIDVAEVHDCFAIAEIMNIEALGFVPEGKGGPAVEAGETDLGGRIPVNMSGGLKSKGHPVGATGVAQVVEIYHQLRGESGERQVEGAKVGLAQNMGGTGASSVVHILEAI
jgi:acetyl-CoA C-acetyltransferase